MRLQGYDYSREGAYFITLCTKDRELLFSSKPTSDMVSEYWNIISEKYAGVELDEYVIMPNHVHGILFLPYVGADRCVGPFDNKPDLIRMMQWFKTMTTNAYLTGIKEKGWPPYNGKLWQRGYYERIIRSEEELNILRGYIRENPVK